MGPKYRQLIGHEPAAETAEREIDRAAMYVPSRINVSWLTYFTSATKKETSVTLSRNPPLPAVNYTS
jgi:hypothetical protein